MTLYQARPMTLADISKRFECGSWDSDDFKWLRTKAAQHAEMLEALEVALDELHEMNLANRYHNPPRNPDLTILAEAKVKASIRKAKGEL